MTARGQAWDEVRRFALGLPAAEEDFPWGETVIKVRRKAGIPPGRKEGVHGAMFLWMGQRDLVMLLGGSRFRVANLESMGEEFPQDGARAPRDSPLWNAWDTRLTSSSTCDAER